MARYKIQGKAEQLQGIYYEFDPSEEPLGVGGMGKVYKGLCVNEKNGLTKWVAIKFMYDDLPPQAIERARREAAIRIHHDNLVEMLGFIETDERGPLGETKHRYHVVSELLEGVMLDDLLIGKLTDRNGILVPYAQKLYNDFQKDPYYFAVNIIRNVLSGLMALHDNGYIHRDIDPTNIMVTTDGRIKLIDFGIAKQRRSLTTNDKSLTVAGVFMGKPEYAAPELVLGDVKSQDQTTDIYSVGILFFQCLVGHPPFEGDRHEVLSMQLHSKMPLQLIKNKYVRKIVETATEKARSKRYQSAAEFRVALDHLPAQLTDSAFEWKPVYTIISTAIAACIAILLTVILWPKDLGSGFDGGDDNPPVYVSAYVSALGKLYDKETAQQGLNEMEQLSNKGNADATYLLSRVYFQSNAAQDFCPDSIKQIRGNLGLIIDNGKAHQLLQKTIKQDSSYYKAIFELGCDYFGGASRATEYNRNLNEAIQLFKEALPYAQQANDGEFISRIQTNIQKLENIL